MSKNVNAKTRKSKQKNKNKKLLKKMMDNSEYDNNNNLDLDDDLTLKQNIKILIGGNNIVEPTNFDKIFLGYNQPLDIESPISKMIDEAGKVAENVEEVAETVASVGTGIALKKISDMAGYEGKTPEEITNEIKNDAEQIKQINNYFKTEDGKESLEDIKETLNTATGVINESIEEIPKQLNNSMEEIGKAGVKVGVGLATEIPIVAPIVGLSNMVEGTEKAIDATANAVEKVANITSDTAEEIKKPINEIQNKITTISDEVDKATNIEQIPKLVNIPNDNSMQVGGSDINKFNARIQNGGKKIKKRINTTRNAFRNISKNVSLKRKLTQS